MNKSEMIDQIAKSADLSKAAAARALDATIAAVQATLKESGMVTLVGFGTFYVGERAARTGSQSAHRGLDRDQGGQGPQVPGW